MNISSILQTTGIKLFAQCFICPGYDNYANFICPILSRDLKSSYIDSVT